MNANKKNTWKLHTTEHVGSFPRPKNPRMWVSATCTTSDIANDKGEGLNFCVVWTQDGWVIDNWVERLDEMPEFSDEVFEALLTSFSGEIEIEA